MKIVVLDGYAEKPGDLSWSDLEALGELTVWDRTPSVPDNAEIVKRAKGAGAVLVNKTPLSAGTLAALAPELRYIGVLATGYNVVDIDAAQKLGVPVCNVPSYGTTAVAQFTMALLLELCHHIGEHSLAVRNGEWSRSPDFCFWNTPLIELSGKTMGIIGYGRIGHAVARLASAFGMRVLAYGRHAESDDAAEAVGLDELLGSSDVISLHCPLSPQTKGLVSRDTIARMKDGVLLLNTSRGPLIVEEDLARALHSGKIAGAGLDVLAEEPARETNPLLAEKNCLITPHIAWASRESRQRLMDIAVQNLAAFLNGQPQNIVNF